MKEFYEALKEDSQKEGAKLKAVFAICDYQPDERNKKLLNLLDWTEDNKDSTEGRPYKVTNVTEFDFTLEVSHRGLCNILRRLEKTGGVVPLK